MKPIYLTAMIVVVVNGWTFADEPKRNSTVSRFVSALDSLSSDQAESDALKLAARLTSELKFGSELEKAKHGRSSDERLLSSLRKRKADDETKLSKIKSWLRKQHRVVSEANKEDREDLKQRFMLLVYRQGDQVASLEARIKEFSRQIAVMEHRVNRGVAYENSLRDRLDASEAFGSNVEQLAALPDDISSVVVAPVSPSDRMANANPAQSNTLKRLYAEVTRTAGATR